MDAKVVCRSCACTHGLPWTSLDDILWKKGIVCCPLFGQRKVSEVKVSDCPFAAERLILSDNTCEVKENVKR